MEEWEETIKAYRQILILWNFRNAEHHITFWISSWGFYNEPFPNEKWTKEVFLIVNDNE